MSAGDLDQKVHVYVVSSSLNQIQMFFGKIMVVVEFNLGRP